jgi:hypothetical protein
MKAGSTEAACARLQSTSGGASDTELNELAVNPTSSPPAPRAVTMVTPVANMPSAARNSRDENAGARACMGRGSSWDTVIAIGGRENRRHYGQGEYALFGWGCWRGGWRGNWVAGGFRF